MRKGEFNRHLRNHDYFVSAADKVKSRRLYPYAGDCNCGAGNEAIEHACDCPAVREIAREGIGSGDAPAQRKTQFSPEENTFATAAEQSPTHDFTCQECGGLFACTCSEPANHINWTRGFNVCASCRRESKKKWDQAAGELRRLTASYGR